jgi:hypothetical protein
MRHLAYLRDGAALVGEVRAGHRPTHPLYRLGLGATSGTSIEAVVTINGRKHWVWRAAGSMERRARR